MKHLYLLLTILSLQLSSCQNKKTMKNDVFQWQETISCPTGYAVDVYEGGLISKDNFTSLCLGVYIGKDGWGKGSSGMSYGEKTIPNHLRLVWASYIEHKFYEIDTPIDYDKMVELFSEGYYYPSSNNEKPEPYKQNYNNIVVGLAPGGVVVIWVAGIGRQVEVGRYEGKEITFSKEEIEALPSGHRKNMHNIAYQEKILSHHSKFVNVINEIKNKPIPYGLWDTYRIKYNWQVKFLFSHNEKIEKITYDLYNGEEEELFGKSVTEKYPYIPEILKTETKRSRAIPKIISFRWVVSNSLYGCYIEFNNEEIMSAFERVLGNDPKAEVEIEIYVNTDRTDATVALKSKDKKVALFNCEIIVNKR